MKKIIFHPFTSIIITFICIALLISLNKTKNKTVLSAQNIDTLEKEIAVLTQEVNQDKQNLNKSEQSISKEKIIRNELLLQKEGEIVIQLPDIDKKNDNNMLLETNSPWEEWKKLLF